MFYTDMFLQKPRFQDFSTEPFVYLFLQIKFEEKTIVTIKTMKYTAK